jgi:hypothetical protein
MNEAYPDKLVAAWMGTLLTFWISYVSWVLANIMTESSHGFQKCDRNSGHRVHIILSSDFVLMIIYLSTPTVRSCWSQWVVIAVVTAFHGESDGLSEFLSNSHEVMTLESVVLKEHFSELTGAICVVFPSFQEVLGSVVKTWSIFLTVNGQAFWSITSLPQT